MKVAFRVDASASLGSGHLMRCLTLADELAVHGDDSTFLCASLPAHLAALLSRHGHQLVELGADDGGEADDAAATRRALDGRQVDVLVVDHYGLAAVWETALRDRARLVLAIDDLGRRHECDLLLDQNYHPDAAARYAGRIPPHCQALIGPRYALLRREFAEARSRVEVRQGPVRRVLISMGGTDPLNLTEKAIEALATVAGGPLTVDVVLGAGHPRAAAVRALCAAHAGFVFHEQTSRMAELLAEADLAIGAAGSSSWERCALGVPSLAICVAENQRELLRQLARHGCVYAPDGEPPLGPPLPLHLSALLGNEALRASLSAAGMHLVDGRGAARVASALRAADVSVRPAVAADCDLIHAWRNAPGVRAASIDAREIPLADHRAWFERALASPDRHLLVGEREGAPVGVVRFDVRGSGAEVSIFLAPDAAGRGLGPGLLRAGERWLAARRPEVSSVVAQVLATNRPSRTLFEQSGYRPVSTHYEKEIAA